MFAAVAGIVGYPVFATRFDPHDENMGARGLAFLAVCLIGISQIGAIVCSLGILSTGVLKQQHDIDQAKAAPENITSIADESAESAPLLGSRAGVKNTMKLTELKGSVAGMYSFYGGAGILILTKAGGALFDKSTTAAPFYMMASFNGVLLLATIATSLIHR